MCTVVEGEMPLVHEFRPGQGIGVAFTQVRQHGINVFAENRIEREKADLFRTQSFALPVK